MSSMFDSVVAFLKNTFRAGLARLCLNFGVPAKTVLVNVERGLTVRLNHLLSFLRTLTSARVSYSALPCTQMRPRSLVPHEHAHTSTRFSRSQLIL